MYKYFRPFCIAFFQKKDNWRFQGQGYADLQFEFIGIIAAKPRKYRQQPLKILK